MTVPSKILNRMTAEQRKAATSKKWAGKLIIEDQYRTEIYNDLLNEREIHMVITLDGPICPWKSFVKSVERCRAAQQ